MRPMGQFCLIVVLILFGFLFFGFVTGFVFLFQVPLLIVGGWIFFLYRVVGQIEWAGGEIGLALGCVAALVFGTHWFLKSFSSNKAGAADTRANQLAGWTLRKTISAVGLLLLFFVAGTSAVGIVHESIWIMTSRDPMLDDNWDVARRTQDMNQLKMLALASHNHESVFKKLPAGTLFGNNGEMLHGWGSQLLPYLEGQALHDQIDFDQAWNSDVNRELFKTRVQTFESPWNGRNRFRESNGFPASDFASNVRVIGPQKPITFGEIPGGSSSTIMYGSVTGGLKPWGHPTNWRDPANGIGNNPDQFGSHYGSHGPPLVLFALCDGSVQTIDANIDPEVLRRMSTPEDDGSINEF